MRLGCHLGDVAAAKRIRAIRDVDDEHHLTLVWRDLAEIGRFARLDNWQFRIVRQGTPGAYTFLLPARAKCRGDCSIRSAAPSACACPAHAGGACTAGRTGRAHPVVDADLAWRTRAAKRCGRDPRRLERALDLVIDAGPCVAEPTTVIDLAIEPPVVVRRGAGDLGAARAPGVERVLRHGLSRPACGMTRTQGKMRP